MQSDNFGVCAVADVAFRCLRGARMELKIATAFLLLVSLVVVAFKLDGFTLETQKDLSKIVIVSVTMCGAIVVGLIFTLFRAGEEAATGRRTPDHWDATPTAFHNMLLIIPTGAAVGAALLFASAGLATERSIISGGDRWLILVLLLLGMWSIYMVLSSSRFLFSYAKAQTQRAEKAQSEVAEARLAALQAQMNPHFLFNTLNTVAALVRTDAKQAEAIVENLASVLRRTLDRSRHTVTTVGEEIDYVRDYLAIECERFGDRLRVDWSVPPELRQGELPTMTLQPLIENALKYGIAARIEGGRVDVRVRRDREDLVLEVIDDGPGFGTGFSEGTGLGNLRRRLEVLFGTPYGLEVVPGEGGHVRVRIPFVLKSSSSRASQENSGARA